MNEGVNDEWIYFGVVGYIYFIMKEIGFLNEN